MVYLAQCAVPYSKLMLSPSYHVADTDGTSVSQLSLFRKANSPPRAFRVKEEMN